MLKKLLLLSTLFLCSFYSNAQKQNNFKLATAIGFPIGTASENLGLFINIEPKLKVSENIFLGMRFAMVVNVQKFSNRDSTQFVIRNEFDDGFFSIVPTVDYYWQKKKFQPYIGVGVGPYSLANTIDVVNVNSAKPADDFFEVKVKRQLGFLIRGGIELKKIQFGFEYNFIPKSTIQTPNEREVIGTVNSSYLGISFGFLISKKGK